MVETKGADLVDLSYRRFQGKAVVTILADKPGGITLEDCAQINQVLSPIFDDFLGGPYLLEVNSPGLDRPLKTPADFAKAMGEKVKVIFRESPMRVVDMVAEITAVKESFITFKKTKDGVVVELSITEIVRAVREIKF